MSLMISKNVIGIYARGGLFAGGGGLFAGGGGLFAGGPFAAGLIAGGLNAATRLCDNNAESYFVNKLDCTSARSPESPEAMPPQ